jgi:pimeloyl-ACP methyl ester carboxylesterase
LDRQVEALAKLIRDQNRSPITLAGHSWGGMLGLRLAAAHPELLHRLVLVNTPLRRTGGATRLGFEAQRAMVSAGLPLRAYGRLAARSLYGERHLAEHPGISRATGEIVASLGRRGTASVIRRVLLEPDDSIAMLRGITVPTTIMAGEDDYVGAEPVPSLLRSAGHTLLRHPGGHMGPVEAPEVVAALLRATVVQAGA